MSAAVLRVAKLSLQLCQGERRLPLVDELSFTLRPGTMTALVGESGSGKSLTARALMGLLPTQIAATGEMYLADAAMHTWSARQWRHHRGREIAMIFQDPLLALNPLRRVGVQLAEVWQRLQGPGVGFFNPALRRRRQSVLCAALERVRLHDPEAVLRAYPHQLSGGMRQRVMIAMALLGQPRLLLADEPTAALDGSSRAGVLQELQRASVLSDCAVLLISHDLSVVEQCCEQILLLYGGRLLEQGASRSVLAQARHPYTAALLAARPQLALQTQALPTIPSQFYPAHRELPGCVFAPRCAYVQARCQRERPVLQSQPGASGAQRQWACHYPLLKGSQG